MNKLTIGCVTAHGLILLFLGGAVSAQWVRQTVDATASFRGLSVVSEKVVWASGTGGTVIRTIDGGSTWKVIKVPDAENLDFRDIEAFDANTAYILSIGNGESSRIYKTTDGGSHWTRQFKNTDPKAFFDAIACWTADSCIAMSDPVGGRFLLITTADGGNKWEPAKLGEPPPARDGEAAFAASGTCLIAVPGFRVYLVTGGNGSRVFSGTQRTRSYSWSAYETPIVKGSAGSGIFSIAMLDRKKGVIVGGNYEKPAESKNNLAFTTDGGKTWTPGSGLTGYRSAVTYIDRRSIIAVGTNGTDISRDGGKTWSKLGSEDLNAVGTKGKRTVFAVGPRGGVYKLKQPQ